MITSHNEVIELLQTSGEVEIPDKMRNSSLAGKILQTFVKSFGITDKNAVIGYLPPTTRQKLTINWESASSKPGCLAPTTIQQRLYTETDEGYSFPATLLPRVLNSLAQANYPVSLDELDPMDFTGAARVAVKRCLNQTDRIYANPYHVVFNTNEQRNAELLAAVDNFITNGECVAIVCGYRKPRAKLLQQVSKLVKRINKRERSCNASTKPHSHVVVQGHVVSKFALDRRVAVIPANQGDAINPDIWKHLIYLESDTACRKGLLEHAERTTTQTYLWRTLDPYRQEPKRELLLESVYGVAGVYSE